MANWNKVTESKFKAVKMLLKGGASVREVVEYLQVSEPVVYGIKKVETYEEYVNVRTTRELEAKQVAAIKAKEAKRVAEKVGADPAAQIAPIVTDDKQPCGTLSANYQMNRLFELVKKQVELLELLNNKVAFVVDELTK